MLPLQAYRSVRSMVEAELQAGVVDFSRPTDSGCRTLLRLHRSLLWLALTLDGLTYEPDQQGRLKTPGELSRYGHTPYCTWLMLYFMYLYFRN